MKTSKWIAGAVVAASLACGATLADAQVAGTQVVGVSIEQASLVVNGWSAKKSLLGKVIYNDRGEKVGVLHDIIVTPDDAVSFAIVAAHQFLGVSAHDVAVPITQIDFIGGKLVWAGATRNALKAMPVFQYSKVRATPIARTEYAHH
ncbi:MULTISPECIES: PRC-barrel domain-containing protein [unclassified Burkholderia]|uniref:PRC-barrel domain-containing protein n=1 Tax=unclassified Burkholderia TaxID=2613784 RepID=UPI00075CDE71|nr:MULTISPECIES: PRC-barrel domain-containing protein [unclassified Burkholderia]KUY62089.1 photosystem reaction center subunit H [Burkholderia sp. RF2-non_BP3]KUY81238.1 photosystem reaction center subunit H [Burkholderia sp. RF4-BP95]KUY89561.1 photosystem reaction center subunit H [Burkholderia sp. RF7-non_BP1]KUY99592.1 photosystem reaction center subunit H [Burkholderia sp. RF7-non_BP4]